jgi:tripartite-type tricarboxylate transporter receptor subunit TctC
MWKAVAAILTVASLAFTSAASAEDWPTRSITMINPFAAGGPNDVLARLFAQRMGEILGQPIILENVGGAGGMIGAGRVVKAAPDGYTFLLGTVGTQAQNQTLYKKPAYDSTTDFAPVALMVDLMSGRVDYLCDIITTAKPQIDGGTVKPIAILTRERSPALPNVPTAIEQGFDIEAYTWNAFSLPKGTPEAIVQKLNLATREAMKTPAVRDKLEAAGLKFVSEDRTTPEYLAKFVQSEIAKWAAPIRASGASVD